MKVGSGTDLAFASASSLAKLIRSRRLSARELLALYLERIERLNAPINAVVTLDVEVASAQANAADQATARGESWGPLHGVPYTLKDTHATKGLRTTAGYPPLSAYVPEGDGTVAARLKAAGGILFGKTNTALLAYEQQTINPIFGRTNNPWDLSRTPSGSSGGAAAALAAGLTPLDVGSDAGGSIRVPAHFCGIYGIKPTFGLVSQYGHIPDLPRRERLDWALSTSGPLARSIDDLELALRLMAGPDGKDSTIPELAPADRESVEAGELRVAWARTFPGTPVSREIAACLEQLANDFDRRGIRVEENLPAISFDEEWDVYQVLSNASWRLRGRLHGIAEVDDGGEIPTLAEVVGAMDRREQLIRQWEAFFDQWDLLLCPPCMTTAYPHIPRGASIVVDGKAARYDDECRHCYEFNLTGHPAMVCPLGLSRDGLPIGGQIVAARWADFKLLHCASLLEPSFGRVGTPAGY